MKLLESLNSVDNIVTQQIDDGAVMNFQAAGQRSGAIFGCKLTNTTNAIRITAGLLMIRGFRCKFEEDETIVALTSSAYPSTNTNYYLYLVITRSGTNATARWEYSTNSKASSLTEIEKTNGSYYYKAGEFTFGPSGIAGNVKSLIATITAAAPSGGSGGSSVGASLPEPRIELVMSAERNGGKGMTASYVALGNKAEYTKYIGQYSVRFVLYRYVERGRFRNRRNGAKLYVNKTGFVKPTSHCGYKESQASMILTANYNNLKSVVIAQNGSYSYRRTDAIAPLLDYITEAFYLYNPTNHTKHSLLDAIEDDDDTEYEFVVEHPQHHHRYHLHASPREMVGYVRATRSKAMKHGSAPDIFYVYKHNYFKFAYKAELYDSNGKKVAESGLSRTIMIGVSPSAVGKVNAERFDFGQLFRVHIDQ